MKQSMSIGTEKEDLKLIKLVNIPGFILYHGNLVLITEIVKFNSFK